MCWFSTDPILQAQCCQLSLGDALRRNVLLQESASRPHQSACLSNFPTTSLHGPPGGSHVTAGLLSHTDAENLRTLRELAYAAVPPQSD
jgi:hypothetical protein